MTLVHYVWDVIFKPQRGYSFNASHTHAYSLIALQEMNLAYKYPIIFWNCACLISDAGGGDNNSENDEETEEENINEEIYFNEMEEFNEEEDEEDEEEGSYEEEDCDGYPVEVIKVTNGKKKKKVKATNYDKIATAIGKMNQAGITVEPPDINKSTYTFSPDPEESIIRYGLNGIVKIGEEIIENIINNRPYSSINDFLNKVKLSKPQMINLIKAGAFDDFGDRKTIMRQYIDSISDVKKRITLQNMKMLIDFELIPNKYDLQCRVYNFNKYLKKFKDGTYYLLDNIAFNFYEKNFDIDLLEVCESAESGFKIKQTIWDKKYQSHMDIIRPYIQKNNKQLLEAVNNKLIEEKWNKYCLGSLSKWEMDSVSFYYHPHELSKVNLSRYDCSDFFKLPETPEIERIIPIKGKQIPLFKIKRIAGTVLAKDKAKKTITLLTTEGVVNVKIYGGVFANYDKQISVRGPDGKKHVIEKSWFSRGNKIIVTGIRQENAFIAKKYSKTPYHLVELITDIKDDGSITVKEEREEIIN